jgi:hypothetical protein
MAAPAGICLATIDAVARLLNADAFNRVRFAFPNADFAGVVSGLSFRAWDDPQSGDILTSNTTINGGSVSLDSG